MVEEFESIWTPENGDYSRKLVEFWCSRALVDMCCNIQEQISDGSFTRFSFDMMLAWEKPCSSDDQQDSFSVCTSIMPTNFVLHIIRFILCV